MRHQIKHRKLNRTSSHRKSLLLNMANSLIINEQIKTTLPKAKELRPYVEKLITIAKKNDLVSRRKLVAILRHNEIAEKLLTNLAVRYNNRNGGYTRIIKIGPRKGDGAEEVIIELV